MKKIMIHAYWRGGGMAFAWALRYCYNRPVLIEPLSLSETRVSQSSIDKAVESSGLSTIHQCKDFMKHMRLNQDYTSEDVARLISMLDAIEGIEGENASAPFVAHKLIGLNSMLSDWDSPGCLHLSLMRNFSGHLDACLASRWMTPTRGMEECSSVNSTDEIPVVLRPIYKKLDNMGVEGFLISSFKPWLVYSYYALLADASGLAQAIHINSIPDNPSYIANAIRDHLGPEPRGFLESELVTPYHWRKPVDKMGDWFDIWSDPDADPQHDKMFWWRGRTTENTIAHGHRALMNKLRRIVLDEPVELLQRVGELIV